MSNSIDITVPDIGDFNEIEVIEVHIAPGDEVQLEDPLITLESDKASMDVPAPMAGSVTEVYIKPGDRVSEGSLIISLIPAEQPDTAEEPEAAIVPVQLPSIKPELPLKPPRVLSKPIAIQGCWLLAPGPAVIQPPFVLPILAWMSRWWSAMPVSVVCV